MRFKIVNLLTGCPAVYLTDSTIENESSSIGRAVINPVGVPKVTGVKYYLTLDNLQTDLIVPTAMERKIPGINANEFDCDDLTTFKRSLSSAMGFGDCFPNRYIRSLNDKRVGNYLNFCKKSGKDVKPYKDERKASIEQLLFSFPESMYTTQPLVAEEVQS